MSEQIEDRYDGYIFHTKVGDITIYKTKEEYEMSPLSIGDFVVEYFPYDKDWRTGLPIDKRWRYIISLQCGPSHGWTSVDKDGFEEKEEATLDSIDWFVKGKHKEWVIENQWENYSLALKGGGVLR